MGRNIRGRLGKLEETGPPSEINWNALFAHDLKAFIDSLPSPPQPAPTTDRVEDALAALTGDSNG